MENDLLPIQNLIYEIRGHKVMLDSDLAMLYGVETKRLNEAVKRNIVRFPIHYRFQLYKNEWNILRSQIATFENDNRKYMPYAFTEQGVAMLSSVLNSEKAIQINKYIIDTFVAIRRYTIEHKDLSQRINELEKYLLTYAKENNQEIELINQALNYLIDVTKPSQIGFKTQ